MRSRGLSEDSKCNMRIAICTRIGLGIVEKIEGSYRQNVGPKEFSTRVCAQGIKKWSVLNVTSFYCQILAVLTDKKAPDLRNQSSSPGANLESESTVR